MSGSKLTFDADRDSIRLLTDRVWRSGIKNLVITVDVPVPGNRGTALRKGFESVSYTHLTLPTILRV